MDPTQEQEQKQGPIPFKLRFRPSGVGFEPMKYSDYLELQAKSLAKVPKRPGRKSRHEKEKQTQILLVSKKKKRLILRKPEPFLSSSTQSSTVFDPNDSVSEFNLINNIPLHDENNIKNITHYAEQFYKLEELQQISQLDDDGNDNNILVLNLLSIQRPFNGEPLVEPPLHSQNPSIYNELLRVVHYTYPFLNAIRKTSELAHLCGNPEKYSNFFSEMIYTICYPYSMLNIDQRVEQWNLERCIRDDLPLGGARDNDVDLLSDSNLDIDLLNW